MTDSVDRAPVLVGVGQIYTDESWSRVFEVLGSPEFLDDERFATRSERARNTALLYREMARLTPAFHTRELVAKCHAAQLPAQAVRDLGDVREDPHLAATGFFSKQEHPSEGTVVAIAPPVAFFLRRQILCLGSRHAWTNIATL
jgi:crotonobetainyl-CoA:carnitine CoA-transferase CaiB-like acyl-CoA transferase